jgi:iron complex transport system permease protein
MNNNLQLPTKSSLFCLSRTNLIFGAIIILILIFFLVDLFFGSVSIKAHDVMKAIFTNADSNITTIILKFRLPKAITALIVGIALSLSGLQMQTVFRNPMAGPDVLGVSSGASLGVAFVILGFSTSISPEGIQGIGNWVLVASAWVGAGAVMILIMSLSARVKDIMTILIIGIMLSSVISAFVTIMQYFSNESMLKTYVVWTMGSLGNLTSGQLKVLLISVSIGVILTLITSKMLNALLLGENYAASIGLNVRVSRILIFTSTSILAGSVTAFCGPIGFIGIAVPHVSRLLFGTSDHKILIPGTILTGGLVMLVSDVISQLPGSERVLPINAVTSLIGIPIVIWVIFHNRRYSGLRK